MEDKEKGPRIAELFGKVDVTEEDVKEAIGLIRATDSIKRCLARAEVFVKEAVSYVANLPESIYKNSMLAIANYIVSRDR
jgi:geranylgeranyl pyrophosphate synthase